MKFDVITIFPEIFTSYLKETLISRALSRKLIDFRVHNLRDWTKDKRKTVDDRPFGGKLGMVMKIDPVLRAVVETKKKNLKSKVILFTPRGKKFNQKAAYNFSKLDQLIMVCGRYEGVDERISKYIADENLSIGDYILMGGELPAMIVAETVTRLIPGVVGDKKKDLLYSRDDFLCQKTKKDGRRIEGMVEIPQYTRPEIFQIKEMMDKSFLKKYGGIEIRDKKLKDIAGLKWSVPKDLISGDHKKIEDWRKKRQKLIWN